MGFLHVGRQRTAHHQPHDHFRAFHPAERGEFRQRHFGQTLRIVDNHIDKLLVPVRVVKPATLAVNLMRNAAGGDNRHVQIFRETFNGTSQCLTKFIAAAGGRNWELQHADLQRDDLRRPAAIVRQQGGKRREQAVIQRFILEERHVEFVCHQAGTDVLRQRRVAFYRRQITRTAAFIGNLIMIVDA